MADYFLAFRHQQVYPWLFRICSTEKDLPADVNSDALHVTTAAHELTTVKFLKVRTPENLL